ncbi:MAG: C39 family peptidase [Oscillospiraceae bacterium]|nr:C39 family peptidase [Oscillospiraceae bacterium]
MKTKRKLLPVLLAAVLLVAAAAIAVVPGLWRDVSFAWQDHTEAELTVKAFADDHGIRYSAYPESLIELLERNPETEEFVLNYPLREDLEIDLSEYDRTQGVPLFMQWDQRWGYMEYGSDVVGVTGCGPTCLAMAGYYVTGDEKFSPDLMVEFALDNGYYAKGSGSSWTLISEGGVKLGLEVKELPLVKKKITDNLKAGNPVICSMRAGDFTTSGHYIVLVGVEDGLFRVNDPNSRENSEKLWSYEQIEGQIRNLWAISARE